MQKQTTRAPKVIDWALMKKTELTLELSRRGMVDMHEDLAASRVLVALHEAAHFITAVEFGLPFYKVAIRGTRGQRPAPGVSGCVFFCLSDKPLSEARFFLAGAAHDHLMLNTATFAVIGDSVDAYPALAKHCLEQNIPPEQLSAVQSDEYVLILRFLQDHWATIRTLACAFLTYSSPDGEIDGMKTQTLHSHVRRDLHEAECGAAYGEVLDRETIVRLLTAPAKKLETFLAKETTRLSDTLKEYGVATFFEQAVRSGVTQWAAT